MARAINTILMVLVVAAGAVGGWVYFGPGQDGPGAAPGGGPPGGARAAAGGARGGPPRGGRGRGGGGRGGWGGGGGTSVVAAPLETHTIVESIEAVGTAQANESVTLTAKVTETARRIGFSDGDYVEAGAVLVELTNEEETAQLAEAQANLDDARAQYARFQGLVEQKSAPVSQLDEARARLRASEARLNGTLARLADRLIRAPFSGMLGFRNISPGTLVTPGTRITTIDDISTIKLDFSVPETYFSALRPGLKVFARSAAWSEDRFEGEIATVGSRIDPVTRSVEVRAHIANTERKLRPGMLLTVDVVKSEREAYAVAESAIVQIGPQAYVFTVTDGRARRVPIDVGTRQFGLVEVTAGVAPGTLVVTDGIVKLRDNMPVEVAGDKPAITRAPPSARREGERNSGGT